MSDRLIGIIGVFMTPAFWLLDNVFLKSFFYTLIKTNSLAASLFTILLASGVFWFFVRRINKLHKTRLNVILESRDKLNEEINLLKNITLGSTNFSKEINKIISDLESILCITEQKKNSGLNSKLDKLERHILTAITRMNFEKNSNVKAKILVPNDKSEHFYIKESTSNTASEIEKFKLAINCSLAGESHQLSQKRIINDVSRDNRNNLYDLGHHESIKGIACIPLFNGSEKYGVLCVTSANIDSFPKDIVDYLSFYSDLIVVVYKIQEMGKYFCKKVTTFEKGGEVNAICPFEQTS